MGIVFGRTGSKEPNYEVLKKADTYEVRRYPNIIVADYPVDNKPGNKNNSAFNALAKFIGVFGNPANSQSKPMAMTAPVLMSEDKAKMSFVMPFELSRNEVPDPTDPNITVREIPEKTVAVYTFSGWFSDEKGESNYKILLDSLQGDGILTDGKDIPFMVAQYHPPFTIPFLRRNEIWIPLESFDPSKF